VRAWLAGDWAAACHAADRLAGFGESPGPAIEAAANARRGNRPAEAAERLTRLPPPGGTLLRQYHALELTQALHLLGRHEEELDSARRATRGGAAHLLVRLLEVRALAALGQVRDVNRAVDACLAGPDRFTMRPALLMREAALELRAHGHPEPADLLLERSVNWMLARPARERMLPPFRRVLGRAYYLVGRWEDAERAFAPPSPESDVLMCWDALPFPQLGGHLDHGYLALLARRRGDEVTGSEAARWLDLVAPRTRYGVARYWQALLAAAAGDADGAAAGLGRAFAEGMPLEMHLHTDPHLERVRAHPAVAACFELVG
jgi:hypothetical protein